MTSEYYLVKAPGISENLFRTAHGKSVAFTDNSIAQSNVQRMVRRRWSQAHDADQSACLAPQGGPSRFPWHYVVKENA